jgi:GntR family transcriptional regulator / MocR family aminotransferase
LQAHFMSGGAQQTSPKRAPHDLRLMPNDDPLPLNDRIYQRIRELIVSGSFEFGSRIASSRHLARSLRVSRSSILNAIDRLVADGFLQPRRGSGVYVAYRGPHRGRDSGQNRLHQTHAVPFAIGTAAVDLFPTQIWAKLQSRRWQQSANLLLQEEEAAGWIGLRKAIATYVASRRGLLCAPEQVFVATHIPLLVDSAMEALDIDSPECWITNPFYAWHVSNLREGKTRLAPTRADESGMDVAHRQQLTPPARAVLVAPSCQFPTGEPLPVARQRELLRWAAAEDIWIFEDGFDWAAGSDAGTSPLAAQAPKRTIYFDTFNHVLFPALGIAYAIVPPPLTKRFERAQRSRVSNASAVNQLVLADFINSGHLDRHVAVLRAAGKERRATLDQVLAKELSDFLSPEPGNGGSHVVCRCEGITASDMVQAAETVGIAITDMADFGINANCHDQVLLGFRNFSPARIESAAMALRQALSNLPRCYNKAATERHGIARHATWTPRAAFQTIGAN